MRARSLHIYAVAAAIGLAVYLIVYPWGHVFGTTPYWDMPFQDERQSLIGYRYFLDGSWHWPVFASDAINVPYTKSVAFLDCVPLWALVNKAIATIVPPWRAFSVHAYLGLWHALVYALQACFGVAVLRLLGHRSWRAGIATALFFVSVPTFIFRYAHSGLSAHWIELWALYLYLRGRIGIAWLYQLAVAAMVYPYHSVISFAVFFASLARTRDRRTIAIWLPLGVLSMLAATWFVGYFAHETARPQWGFEYESANLLSWLVPVRSGIFGDARWIANVMGTEWQYEGYAYLGAGCLVLLALFVPHVRTLRPVIRRHAWLFAILVMFSILALSNHIYFGSHEIASYRIPSLLRWIPHQFRSPGRFVWMPTYVLIVFLLHWGFTRFSSPKRFAVIVAVVALQMIDARGDWQLQRASTSGPRDVQLDIAKWRPLVHAHDAVFVLPPYTCREGEDAVVEDYVAMDIEMLASERALPINGTYSARPWRRCAVERDQWPTLSLQRGALYVLLPLASGAGDVLAVQGARCAAFARGRVCSTDERTIAQAITAGIAQPEPEPPVLALGQPLALAHGIDTSLATAVVRLAVPPRSLHVQVDARLCGQRRSQDIDVRIDGALQGTLHFGATTNEARVLAVGALRADQSIVVELAPHDLRSPAALGCEAGSYPLGFRVERVWFE